MPNQRHVVLAGYYWHIPPNESKPIAESHFDKIIKALTSPLTPEEINPPKAAKASLPPVKVIADTYSAAVEKVQKIFNDNQWSDGLAIIPPTREAVDLMLTGTSRSPDEVIGTVKAKNGTATIEKIAINAVMAGASPAYLPVIIAAMEGLCNPAFDLLHPQASLGGFELAIWVSGPIAKELNMNYRDRLWTYGNRANSSIGRAIVLYRINLGQMWPGINDMAARRTVPFTNFTFAENNTSPNPWMPYHVIQGFSPEASCVSVSTVWPGTETNYRGATAKELLDSVVEDILANRSAVFLQYKPSTANPGAHPRKYVLLVSPETAEELAALGYDQEGLRKYIYAATSIPFEELTPDEIKCIQSRIDQSLAGLGILSDRLPSDRIPVWQEGLRPGGKVPVLITPEDLHFVVVGGQGKSISGWNYIRAPYTWSSHYTSQIRGATLTKAGQ